MKAEIDLVDKLTEVNAMVSGLIEVVSRAAENANYEADTEEANFLYLLKRNLYTVQEQIKECKLMTAGE
mgnify:FL=1